MSQQPALRWRERNAPGDWRCAHPAPADNRGFCERGRYLFEKPGPGWSLRVDDEPLDDIDVQGTGWLWEPGFFAGEVTAELIGPGNASQTFFLLDVAPDATKVGRDVFRQMIEEVWAEDPELVLGSEPATTRAGELGSSENPWLAFARLRQHAPDFLRAAFDLTKCPRRALSVCRTTAPLHHVRNVDRRTAAALIRSPAAALFADQVAVVESRFAAESRLDVPLVHETLDCAANRAMLALLLALVRRATSILALLQRVVDREPESETRTPIARRWPARRQTLEQIEGRLKRLLHRPPFSEVSRPEVTAAGLTTVAADPLYARAWQRGWRALRRGLESGDASERLWISPSWEVYERWCYVRLGRMLATVMPQWGWTRRKDRWAGAFCDRRAELILQPTFRSHHAEIEGMWSISKERVPDLVLRVDSPDGTRFVVLDAKYRASRANVLDAMESAHIYQDSLRIGSRRPEGSLLLVPAAGGANWLEDQAFQARHRVGVRVLTPALDSDAVVPPLMTDALTT